MKNNLDMNSKTMAELRKTDLDDVKLGRFPFSAGIKFYVAKMQPYLSRSTLMENERKLRYFARIFEELKERGEVSTTHPRAMGKEDIEGFIIWMKNRELKPGAQNKYLQVITGYLAIFGNHIIDDMKADRRIRLPPSKDQDSITVLDLDTMQRIFDAADSFPGYRGNMIFGFLALTFGTGCRPKEVIDAEVQDLDMIKQRFFVRHPKGEGTWGVEEWTPIIRGDMIPFIERFLEDRAAYMELNDITTKYLFFNPKTGNQFSLNGIRVLKKHVEEMAGVQFKIKDLRSTLATSCVKDDVNKLKSTSLILRHNSVKTTELYYAKFMKIKAKEALEDEWKKDPIE